jgi:hypothetical protein
MGLLYLTWLPVELDRTRVKFLKNLIWKLYEINKDEKLSDWELKADDGEKLGTELHK